MPDSDAVNIYIHVPFCRGKCGYCAFYSEPIFSGAMFTQWLEKLGCDIESAAVQSPVETLYLGGGTPTLPEPEMLERLYAMLNSHFRFLPSAEITSECNPETLTREKAEVMRGFVNRVSMGAQSFSEKFLSTIQRTSRDPSAPERAFRILRSAGFRNIGLDLIYAIPGESLPGWKCDLETALALKPDHISAYSLTPEEGTRLAGTAVDDSLSEDMWEFAGAFLAEHGLPRYEVSNYASPPFQCRHNDSVWHGRRYFGFGPSASSFDGVTRWTQAKPLSAWLAGTPAEQDPLPREARLREIFVMGLRTVRGWDRSEFDWTFLLPELEKLKNDGLLLLSGTCVKPTLRGLAFWNDLAETLIQEP